MVDTRGKLTAQEAVIARLARDGLSNRRSAAGCSSVPGPGAVPPAQGLRQARDQLAQPAGPRPARRPDHRPAVVPSTGSPLASSAGRWRKRTTPCQPLTPRGGGGLGCRMRTRVPHEKASRRSRMCRGSVGSSRESADSAEARRGRASRPHLTSPVMARSTVRALPRDAARTSDSAADRSRIRRRAWRGLASVGDQRPGRNPAASPDRADESVSPGTAPLGGGAAGGAVSGR